MTDRGTEWNDDRLAAALLGRATARPTPADLSMATVERVRRTAPDRSARLSRRAIAFALTSAAVVTVLVGVVAVVPRRSGPPATAAAALGLPILSVAEAIAVRDGDPGDREIAVRGWFSSAQPLRCPISRNSDNPVRLQCPLTTQWLLDTPKLLGAGRGTPEPGRSGIQALLPFLELSALTTAAKSATAEERLPEVVLIGHFHDRRGHGALCDVPDPAACAGFIADGIHSIDGVRTPTSTIIDMEPLEPELRHEPTWTPAEVDRLFNAALPGLEILSRVAVPGHRISQIEPALGTGALGIIGRDVVWSVTGLDAGTRGVPVRRTFLVVDGTAEAYESAPWEVSNIGFVPFALLSLPIEPSPVAASLEPGNDPFAGAPREVDGIVSATVQMAVDRRYPFDRSEALVRGWFVPHDPAASCPGLDLGAAIKALQRPCNAGRDWILDEPEQLWSDPAKVDIDRQPRVAVLNPLIPSDVPFEVPQIWFGTTPRPLPVVVIGHFTDTRVTGTYAGDQLFVIDQLVWHGAGGSVRRPPVVALTPDTTESVDAILARLTAELGPATDTWVSVVQGSDLSILDPDAAEKPELGAAAAVWIVRRLVDEPYDGGIRHVIATAYTVDGGTRIWNRPACCGLDLATTIDVDPPGSDTGTVAVADYSQWVEGVRTLSGTDRFVWRQIGPVDGWRLQIASGTSPQDVAVRWVANRCQTEWRVDVRIGTQFGPGPYIDPRTTYLEGCATDPVPRAIVLTFDRPIDLDTVTTSDNTSGG